MRHHIGWLETSSSHQTIITLTTVPNVSTVTTIPTLKTVTTNCTNCKISNVFREQVHSERFAVVYQPSNQRYFKQMDKTFFIKAGIYTQVCNAHSTRAASTSAAAAASIDINKFYKRPVGLMQTHLTNITTNITTKTSMLRLHLMVNSCC